MIEIFTLNEKLSFTYLTSLACDLPSCMADMGRVLKTVAHCEQKTLIT